MLDLVVPWIFKLSIIPVGIAAAVAAWRFRSLHAPMRGLAALVGFNLLMELVSRALAAQHRPNLFLAPVDAVGELALLAWVYWHSLRPGWFRRLIPFAVGLFVVCSVPVIAQPDHTPRFSPVQHFIESVLVLVLALRYFYELVQDEEVLPPGQVPLFWVSGGLLVYFAGSILIFVASNWLLLNLSREVNLRVWAFHALLYMLLCGCYARALWLSPRRPARVPG